jgi:hypothetical protein
LTPLVPFRQSHLAESSVRRDVLGGMASTAGSALCGAASAGANFFFSILKARRNYIEIWYI